MYDNLIQNSVIFVFYVSYPPEVRRRIKALKRLQFGTTELEAQFYLDVQQLEAKYQKLYQPLYDKRYDIIRGSHEPTDEEAHWSEDDEDEEGMLHHLFIAQRFSRKIFVLQIQQLPTRKQVK